MELGPEELRVAGCLVEKQLTTPQQYPLTLNALVLACNQASNRNPLVDYDDRTVEQAVAGLKERGLVRFVYPSHGRSATRFRHVLDEVMGLDERQLALVALLTLRGPQTVGELRGRSERMATFAGLEDAEAELVALADRQPPLVLRTAREPGRKEVRWRQLLGDTDAGDAPSGPTTAWDVDDVPRPAPGAALALTDEVAALRDEVDALRRDLDDVLARLGP